jgi:hypothetical protein
MYSLVKTVCGFIFGFVGSFLARTGQGRVQIIYALSSPLLMGRAYFL